LKIKMSKLSYKKKEEEMEEEEGEKGAHSRKLLPPGRK
jgi:hypothetical protein